MTLPAAIDPSLPWIKMMRVEATLSESRNNVISSRIDGKADNSRGLTAYIEARRITIAKVILNEISRSNSIGGNGITIKTRIATTATAMNRSLFFVSAGSFPPYVAWSAVVIIFNKCRLVTNVKMTNRCGLRCLVSLAAGLPVSVFEKANNEYRTRN